MATSAANVQRTRIFWSVLAALSLVVVGLIPLGMTTAHAEGLDPQVSVELVKIQMDPDNGAVNSNHDNPMSSEITYRITFTRGSDGPDLATIDHSFNGQAFDSGTGMLQVGDHPAGLSVDTNYDDKFKFTGQMPKNTTWTVEVTAAFEQPTARFMHDNTVYARVQTPDEDPKFTGNSCDEGDARCIATVIPYLKLSQTVSVNGQPFDPMTQKVHPGDAITYHVTAKNDYDVSITDKLAMYFYGLLDGADFTSQPSGCTEAGWGSSANYSFTCPVSLARHQTQSFDFTYTVKDNPTSFELKNEAGINVATQPATLPKDIRHDAFISDIVYVHGQLDYWKEVVNPKAVYHLGEDVTFKVHIKNNDDVPHSYNGDMQDFSISDSYYGLDYTPERPLTMHKVSGGQPTTTKELEVNTQPQFAFNFKTEEQLAPGEEYVITIPMTVSKNATPMQGVWNAVYTGWQAPQNCAPEESQRFLRCIDLPVEYTMVSVTQYSYLDGADPYANPGTKRWVDDDYQSDTLGGKGYVRYELGFSPQYAPDSTYSMEYILDFADVLDDAEFVDGSLDEGDFTVYMRSDNSTTAPTQEQINHPKAQAVRDSLTVTPLGGTQYKISGQFPGTLQGPEAGGSPEAFVAFDVKVKEGSQRTGNEHTHSLRLRHGYSQQSISDYCAPTMVDRWVASMKDPSVTYTDNRTPDNYDDYVAPVPEPGSSSNLRQRCARLDLMYAPAKEELLGLFTQVNNREVPTDTIDENSYFKYQATIKNEGYLYRSGTFEHYLDDVDDDAIFVPESLREQMTSIHNTNTTVNTSDGRMTFYDVFGIDEPTSSSDLALAYHYGDGESLNQYSAYLPPHLQTVFTFAVKAKNPMSRQKVDHMTKDVMRTFMVPESDKIPREPANRTAQACTTLAQHGISTCLQEYLPIIVHDKAIEKDAANSPATLPGDTKIYEGDRVNYKLTFSAKTANPDMANKYNQKVTYRDTLEKTPGYLNVANPTDEDVTTQRPAAHKADYTFVVPKTGTKTLTIPATVKAKADWPQGDNHFVLNYVADQEFADMPGTELPAGDDCVKSTDPGEWQCAKALLYERNIAPLTVEKSVEGTDDVNFVKPGETLTFTLTFKNPNATAVDADYLDLAGHVVDDADLLLENVTKPDGWTLTKSGQDDQTTLAVKGSVPAATDANNPGTVTVKYKAKVKAVTELGDAVISNFVVENPADGSQPTLPDVTSCDDSDKTCTTSYVDAIVAQLSAQPASGSEVDASTDDAPSTITYTLNVRNMAANLANVPARAYSFVNDMTHVIDEADFNNDLKKGDEDASSLMSDNKVNLAGTLAPQGQVSYTYSVTVKQKDALLDKKLLNTMAAAGQAQPTTCVQPDPNTVYPMCAVHTIAVASEPDPDQPITPTPDPVTPQPEPKQTPKVSLATTGSDALGLAGIAGVAVIIGAGLVLMRRKKVDAD